MKPGDICIVQNPNYTIYNQLVIIDSKVVPEVGYIKVQTRESDPDYCLFWLLFEKDLVKIGEL